MTSSIEPSLSEILALQKAFKWELRQSSVEFRLEKISTLSQWISQNEADIKNAAFDDFRKSHFEVYLTEIFPVQQEIAFLKRNLSAFFRPRKVSASLFSLGSEAEVRREPRGQVLILAPWNYPFALALQPLVAAIATGNTVILKPSELTPHCSALLARMIREIFPTKWAHVAEGGPSIAEQLITYPFDHIFFTGSTDNGRKVMAAAANNLTSVTLELGGKCPVIVHSSAQIKTAAKRIAWGKTLNAGQTCIAPDFAYIHKSIFTEFLRRLESELHHFGASEMTSIVSESHLTRLTGFTQSQYPFEIEEHRKLQPRIMISPTMDSPVMQQEVFGPILPCLPFDTPEEVLQQLRQMPSPLAIYVFSEDDKFTEKILANTQSGGAAINDVALQWINQELPFGGVGASGMGSYHGVYSLRAFTHERSVLKQSLTGPLAKMISAARENFYPPVSKDKLKWLKRVLGALN